MWSKRQRYIFMKRSKRARTVWLLTGSLVVIGLIWFTSQLALSTANMGTEKAELSRDQSVQTPAKDQPGPQATEEQTQGSEAVKDTPPKEEGEALNTLPASPSAQPTPPSGAAPFTSSSPASPAPSSAPSPSSYPPSPSSPSSSAELPSNPLQAPNTYPPYKPNYSDYWSYGPTYSEYWQYGSNYWGY